MPVLSYTIGNAKLHHCFLFWTFHYFELLWSQSFCLVWTCQCRVGPRTEVPDVTGEEDCWVGGPRLLWLFIYPPHMMVPEGFPWPVSPHYIVHFECDKFTATSAASLAIVIIADGHFWNVLNMTDVVLDIFKHFL